MIGIKSLKKEKVRKFWEFIPYAALVGKGGVGITKNGFFLRTFRCEANDLSFSHESQIFEIFRSLNNCFRVFSDGGWGLYLDSFRGEISLEGSVFNEVAPEVAKVFESYRESSLGNFYASEHFLTICFNPYSMKSKFSDMLFYKDKDKTTKDEREKRDFYRALDVFVNRTIDIEKMLGDVFRVVKPLDNDETMTFYHRCVSNTYHPVKTPFIPMYLDVVLSDSTFIPDTITKLDDSFVHTLSINDFPSETDLGMISEIMSTNMNFHFSLRFLSISKDEARSKIKALRKSHFQKRKGLGGAIHEAITKEEVLLEDTEALAQAEDSSEALSLLTEGMSLGNVSGVFVVMDEVWEVGKDTIKKIKKILNAHGYIAKEETLGNPLAFLGTFHGNVDYNPRSLLISTSNLSCLFPISGEWRGDFLNDHLKEVSGVGHPHMLTRFGPNHFYLNFNVGDVGHALVVGPTGSGKSIFLAATALQFFRYPGAKVVFFDKDKSSENVCRNVGGLFLDVGSESCEHRLNPFVDISDKSHQLWLSKYLCEYFRSKNLGLTPQDEAEVFTALESMALSGLSDFNGFRSQVQQKVIRVALAPFVKSDDKEGEYSRFFTSDDDDIGDVPWVTFELGSLMNMEESIIKFVLGCLFQKVTRTFTGNPVMLIVDEAWLFLDNDFFAGMLKEWLKTLRKKNVYVVLATQEMADVNHTISSTIANACMTKFFLPNNQSWQSENRRLYRDLGLSDDDLDVLVNARPKRDYFYVSPKGKQLFELCLDERQLEILKGVKG